MTTEVVIDIAREALWLIIKCSAPLLLVSLIVGLVISIFQTVTSIQEQTLTFVPKIISIFIALLIFGSFIMGTLVNFITDLWSNFDVYIK